FRPDPIRRIPVKSIPEKDREAPLFFQSLVHGTFLEGKQRPHETDYVFERIHALLLQTSEAFVPRKKLKSLDVLSLCGRALFFRFLIDRRIVRDGESGEICPAADNLKDAFSTARAAAQTSAWLDVTFNGDFLPL